MAHGKNYRNAKSLFEREREYSPAEAVRIIKQMPTAKFDETIEVHFRLGLNVRHADEQLRGTLMLPHGTGKDAKVAVFAEGDKAKEASSAPPISPSGSRRDSPTSTSRSPRPTRWGTSGSSAGSSARAA
jgi:ribosomal protein L1